jgi:hypothetical protein
MRITSCITKATDIHPEYVILIAFPRQQRLHECASKVRYKYIACLASFPFSDVRVMVENNYLLLLLPFSQRLKWRDRQYGEENDKEFFGSTSAPFRIRHQQTCHKPHAISDNQKSIHMLCYTNFNYQYCISDRNDPSAFNTYHKDAHHSIIM